VIDISLREAERRQILEAWHNIGSYILTVFKHNVNILPHRPLPVNPPY